MAINDDKMASDERDPQLARLYEAAGDEAPSSALDAAILAAARREVNAGPRTVDAGGAAGGGGGVAPVVRQKRNWYVPMSIAAVLVLSVSLVTLVHEEKGDELAQPPMPRPPAPAKVKRAEQPAPAPDVPAKVKAPASKDDSVAPRTEAYSTGAAPAPAPAGKIVQRKDEPKPKAPEAAGETGALKKEAPATTALPDLAAQAPAGTPLPSEPVRAAERPRTKPGTGGIGIRGFGDGPAAQGGTAAPRPREEADVRERRAAPSAFPAAPGTAPADSMRRDQSRSAAEEIARPAPPPAATGSVRQDAAQRAESQRESAAKQAATPAPVEGRAQSAPAAVAAAKPAPSPMATKPPPLMRAAPKPPARPAWLVELDLQPPERWLDKLAEFRRDGRNAEADELLAEFRKRFPDHPASVR